MLLPRDERRAAGGLGCRPGCSARAGLGPGRADLPRHHARATGSSTPSTTRSCLPSAATAPPGTRCCPGLNPLRPTSSPACSPRPSKPPESGSGRGSERLVLFRRANLCQPVPSPPKKLSGDPRPDPAPRPSKFEVEPCERCRPWFGACAANDLADRAREAAPGRRRGAGDRHRRPRLRRQPDLGQHPPRRLRALDRHRADDPRSASGSPCPRRCRASRSAARAASTPARSNRWASGWR